MCVVLMALSRSLNRHYLCRVIGVRVIGVSNQLIHAMPVRSPLTAALRQRSRRPARQVACPLAVFLQLHFCGSKNPAIPITDKETFLKPNSSLRPNRRGRFFRAKAEKKSAPDGSACACLNASTEKIPNLTDGSAYACLNRVAETFPSLPCATPGHRAG